MKEQEPTINDVMAALDATMKRISGPLNWDAPRAFRMPKDPAGRIRLSYLGHQGSMSVALEDAKGYLEWLKMGNMATISRWAALNGRRLK